MKSEYVNGLWERALRAAHDAKTALSYSPDNTANRAYYAAFYAVSALFASENQFFKKHSGLRAAVHKELVNARKWPAEIGAAYNELYKLREVADYGVLQHATHHDAANAVEQAERIIEMVHNSRPDLFDINLPMDNANE